MIVSVRFSDACQAPHGRACEDSPGAITRCLRHDPTDFAGDAFLVTTDTTRPCPDGAPLISLAQKFVHYHMR